MENDSEIQSEESTDYALPKVPSHETVEGGRHFTPIEELDEEYPQSHKVVERRRRHDKRHIKWSHKNVVSMDDQRMRKDSALTEEHGDDDDSSYGGTQDSMGSEFLLDMENQVNRLPVWKRLIVQTAGAFQALCIEKYPFHSKGFWTFTFLLVWIVQLLQLVGLHFVIPLYLGEEGGMSESIFSFLEDFVVFGRMDVNYMRSLTRAVIYGVVFLVLLGLLMHTVSRKRTASEDSEIPRLMYSIMFLIVALAPILITPTVIALGSMVNCRGDSIDDAYLLKMNGDYWMIDDSKIECFSTPHVLYFLTCCFLIILSGGLSIVSSHLFVPGVAKFQTSFDRYFSWLDTLFIFDILLLAASMFVFGNRMIVSLVGLFLSIALFILSLFIPQYKLKVMNYAKVGGCSAILLTSLISVIQAFGGGDFVVWIWMGLLIPVCILGAWVLKLRMTRLNSNNTSATVAPTSSTPSEMPDSEMGMQGGYQSSETLESPLPRFRNALDAIVSVRWKYDAGRGNPGEEFYDNFGDAMEMFPDSVFLRFCTVEYFLAIAESHNYASSKVNSLLSRIKTNLTDLLLLNQMEYFVLEGMRIEVESSGGMRKSRMMCGAMRKQKAIRTTIATFWKALSQETVEMRVLFDLVISIEKYESATRRIYSVLLDKHANDPVVLNSYAAFIEEVEKDKRVAEYYRFLAAQKEQENQRRHGKQKSSSAAASGRSIRGLTTDKRSKQDERQHAGDSIGTSNELEQYDARDANEAILKKSSAVLRLAWSVRISIILVLLAILAIHLVGGESMTTIVDDAALVGAAGGTRKLSQEGFYKSRMIELIRDGYRPDLDLASFQSSLYSTATKIETKASDLFQSVFNREDILQVWRKTDVFLKVFQENTNSHVLEATSRREMYTSYVRALRHVADLSDLSPGEFWTDPEWRFVLDNGPLSILDNIWVLVNAYQDFYTDTVEQQMTLMKILIGAAIGIPLILIIAVFMPSIFAIKREKREIFQLFLLIPKSTVSRVYHQFSKGKGDGVHGDAQASESVGKEVDLTLRSTYSGKKKMSTVAKVFILYVFCLFVLVVVAVAILLLFMSTGQSYAERAYEINYAGSRRSFAYKLFAMGTELIRNDTEIWTQDRVREEIKKTVGILREYHGAVLYGSSKLGPPGSVGRDPKQDSLLFDSQCSDTSELECLGMDSMMHHYLEQCLMITRVPDSDLHWNLTLYKEIDYVQDQLLGPMLSASKALYLAEAAPIVDESRSSATLLFVLSFPIAIVLYIIFLHHSISKVNNEVRQTRKMLRLLPPKVIQEVPALRDYFMHGARSQQVNLEQAIKESEERTKSVLAASVDAVLQTNGSGIIEVVNSATEKMFLCSRTELLGQPIDTILKKSNAAVEPSTLPAGEEDEEKSISRIMNDLKKSGKMGDAIVKNMTAYRRDEYSNTFPVKVSICTGKVRGRIVFATFVRDMTNELKHEKLLKEERRRADELLLNMLPRSVATQLKSGKKDVSQGFDSATVVFIDLVKFTSLSSTMSPTKLVNFLNAIFTKMENVAIRHKLEKIKTIGDCFMAVGGLFERFHDHALAVVEFGLEVLEFVEEYKKETGMNIDVRVGANSGPLVAGVIGEKRYAFDIWGETVNIASRMESQGIAGKIQLSRSTYRMVYDKYQCEERGEIEVKGIGAMVTYLVDGKLV